MFVVSEAEAAAIRTAFERAGRVVGRNRVAAPVPWYHRQPAGAGCRARHRRLEATAATPCQAASAPEDPEAVPRDARRHPVNTSGGPDLDHRFPRTVSAGRAYRGIGRAGSASGSFDQSHVQSLPAKRLGGKSDYPHAIAPGFDVTSLPSAACNRSPKPISKNPLSCL